MISDFYFSPHFFFYLVVYPTCHRKKNYQINICKKNSVKENSGFIHLFFFPYKAECVRHLGCVRYKANSWYLLTALVAFSMTNITSMSRWWLTKCTPTFRHMWQYSMLLIFRSEKRCLHCLLFYSKGKKRGGVNLQKIFRLLHPR